VSKCRFNHVASTDNERTFYIKGKYDQNNLVIKYKNRITQKVVSVCHILIMFMKSRSLTKSFVRIVEVCAVERIKIIAMYDFYLLTYSMEQSPS
jgi:hypothetical protein